MKGITLESDEEETPSGPSKNSIQTLYEWTCNRADELKIQYQQRDDGKAPMVHVPTGLSELDEVGLLEPGILTILVAHPGDGKTAAALQIAEGCAKAGFDVQAYFMEDPRKMVSDRVIAPIMGESAFKMRRLKMEANAAEVSGRLDAVKRDIEWTKRVWVDDEHHETAELMELIEQRRTKRTKLVIVDYLQAFDAEQDEHSVERVLARVVWGMNQKAKAWDAAFLALAQPKTREVEDRGRRWFEACRWKARGKSDDKDVEPTLEWVEGFRPTAGDIQWATGAVKQRSRQIISVFRPNSWMRMMGINVPDDRSEIQLCKGNYGPNNQKLVFGWNGPTSRLIERKAKQK
jgi:replicative DNA helicase